MSRTTCKLIGEDIVYTHVHVYTRDLSVNRLLMRRNKIMAFACVGKVITNVFSGPWMVDARDGGGRNNIGFENLYRCTPSQASLDISYLLAK